MFENLKAVAEAAGGSLAQAVKLNVYLTDLAHFAKVNEIMAHLLSAALSGAGRRRRRAAAPRRARRDRVRPVSWLTVRRSAVRHPES